MFDLVVASGNPGKLREIERILGAAVPVRLRAVTAWPGYVAPEETGSSFADNALIKAAAAMRATGLPALADDSGLCVEALGGAPGVHSARFAGRHGDDAANNALLLERLAGLPPSRRRAWFQCVVAVVTPALAVSVDAPAGVRRVTEHPSLRPGETGWLAEGRVDGVIAETPRGDGGFGYDPVFFYPPAGRTFAELDPGEKDAVSHRRRALAKMRPLLAEICARREG